MMYDTRWTSLLKPGSGDSFFTVPGQTAFIPAPLDLMGRDFSLHRAWWLSELCRLVYRRCGEEADVPPGFRSRSDFLKTVGLSESRFFNAGSVQAAIVTDRQARRGVLVFRGTNCFENWFSNLNTFQSPWHRGGMVHQGFKQEFHRIWPAIETALNETNLPMIYTGHSLGGALATLAASDTPPRAVYTFGSPKVGDAAFAMTLSEIPVYRVTMPGDIVTTVPPSRIPFDFCHAGDWRPLPPASTPDTDAPPAERNGFKNLLTREWGRRLITPPEFLSDHSPVNYSFRIASEILKQRRRTEPVEIPPATIPT